MLGVSRSGYYAWRRRSPSERARFDAVLTEKIETIHRNSRATYGSPRVHAELAAIGIRCSRKRVARLMRQQKLRGCLRGRRIKTTYRVALQHAAAPDLVGRNFAAAEPDRLWVADITYIRSGEGFLYLAFILDVCSRKVVGWSMATHLRTDRACGGCPRDGDRKEETLSRARASFGSGRAVHGSVLRPAPGGGRHRTLDGKRRLCLRQRPRRELRGNSEERASLPGKVAHPPGCQDGFSAEYIEGFYNTRRRHSALGQISPAEFEEVRLRDEDVA